MAPVPIGNEKLGGAAGRSPDIETAAIIMSVLLFMAIILYGNLVLTGVAEERSSRVVEVLLARMQGRTRGPRRSRGCLAAGGLPSAVPPGAVSPGCGPVVLLLC